MRVKSVRYDDDIDLMTTDKEKANWNASSQNEHSRKYVIEINLDKRQNWWQWWNMKREELTELDGFNKIAIQTTAQMAADKEAVSLSRVHT